MFNALKYTEELERAGFTRTQAETSIKVLIEVMNDEFATKSDLLLGFRDARGELRAEIAGVKSELKQEIADVKSELKQEIADVKSQLKQEIADVKSELKQEIGELRTEVRELRSDMESRFQKVDSRFDHLEYRLTIKMGTFMTVAVGLAVSIVAVLK